MFTAVQNFIDEKGLRYGIAFLLLFGLGTGIWFGYKWYQKGKEQAAFKELAESVDAYTVALAGTESKEKLMDSERAFLAGSTAHQSSALYPFFLAFQADAFMRQGKIREAAEQLDKALAVMDKKNPLYYLYALKTALVNIDTKDATREQRGRAQLEELSNDVANPLQEMALVYSGLDARARGEKALALTKFNAVTARSKKDSFWRQLVEMKLKSGD